MKKVAHINSLLLSSGTNNSHRTAFILLEVKQCDIPFIVCDYFRLQTVCVQVILCQFNIAFDMTTFDLIEIL
jgi:hypothetical protein